MYLLTFVLGAVHFSHQLHGELAHRAGDFFTTLTRYDSYLTVQLFWRSAYHTVQWS